MSKALIAFKTRHQKKLEADYPATVIIGGTEYKGCAVSMNGQYLTMDGGTNQQRSFIFQAFASVLPLAVVRDTAQPSQPLRRGLRITHKKSGIVYRLDQEQTDVHDVQRMLTCIQEDA